MLRLERALPVLAVLAGLAGSPAAVMAQTGTADPAAVQMLAPQETGSATCGAYQVTWKNNRSNDVATPGQAVLRATTSSGAPALELSRPLTPGERLIPLWCGDILGDGSQALGYETFSGGAHCCFSATVVLLQPHAHPLLEADFGNGGFLQPQQLDDSGPLELPATSDVFAYFDHLSFAASPFMPLVFAYDGSQYVEATRQFPDLIRSELDQADAALTEAVGRPVQPGVPDELAYQEQESIALRLFGLHWLLGDADEALPGIEARVAAPVGAWLDANAPDATEALQQRYAPTPTEEAQ